MDVQNDATELTRQAHPALDAIQDDMRVLAELEEQIKAAMRERWSLREFHIGSHLRKAASLIDMARQNLRGVDRTVHRALKGGKDDYDW
jgi:hypothetical protein